MKRLFFISLFLLSFSLYAETVYENKNHNRSLIVEKNDNGYILTTEDIVKDDTLVICVVTLRDESSAGDLVYKLEGSFLSYRTVLEQLKDDTYLTKIDERKYFSNNRLVVEIKYTH